MKNKLVWGFPLTPTRLSEAERDSLKNLNNSTTLNVESTATELGRDPDMLHNVPTACSRKKNKSSPRRMPLALFSQRVNSWYHTGPRDEWKRVRGWHGQFFFNGLGLSLGEKLVSTNGRLSYSSIIFRLFQSGCEKKNCAVFCTNRLEVLQGM